MKAKTIIPLFVAFLVIMAFLPYVDQKPYPNDEPSGRLELDTKVLPAKDHLRIGIDVYVPPNYFFFGTITGIDDKHDFGDGVLKPGIETEKNDFRSWVPRAGLEKMVVKESDVR